MKKIYIPHINYTVHIKEFKKAPETMPLAKAYCEQIDSKSCNLFLPKGKQHPGDVSHELIHVLQFICLNRSISFDSETEHMAYLMHWMMGQIMGWKYQ